MVDLRLVSQKVGSVLVVGGGIAGIQAALDLANSGFFVYLVEASPAIGGTQAQLDKTFPTNDCSLCILSPKLVECGRHPNIKLLTLAQVAGISGQPGNFTVKITQKPRFVDPEKCVGCGACAEVCPTKVPDNFNQGLAKKKAISVKYEQAVPLVYYINAEKCLYLSKGKPQGKDICRKCESACKSNAINFNDTTKELELQVGAVILAPGFEEFDPKNLINYGYGKYPNVVTSIEFERMMSASGPFKGHIVRPSDHKEPRKIAWIQCVGSRDMAQCGNGYCSSVCCTYAVKEAIIAKEHNGKDLETTIFNMDIRTFGKDFEKYYIRSKKEYGVRYVNSRVYALEEEPETKLIKIRYSDLSGNIFTEEFDIVVLSVGINPFPGAVQLAENLELNLNKYGFALTSTFRPVQTNQKGIYVCGAFQSPQDIPSTVMQASAAAGEAAGFLAPARHTLEKAINYPPERNVVGEKPRIGVFVCHCGINIGGVVDVPAVKEYAETLPNVIYADNLLYTCSQDSQEKIKSVILKHNLNRVVVASCTPRTHESLFQQTLREAGLNPYLFEMANIREQCSWVHMQEPEKATQKAKDLVRKAVRAVALKEPLSMLHLDVVKEALVIGGGIAGMEAGLKITRQGFPVHLVESTGRLGGLAQNIHYTLEEKDVPKYLNKLIQAVENNPLITVYKNSTISDAAGYVGNFISKINTPEGIKEIKHGVTVIAIGGQEYRPREYGYGQSASILTGMELEKKLVEDPKFLQEVQNVVMIQCVGSRNNEHQYCSRVCCSEAVKNALKIKAINPAINVYILYRDMRTYGFKEDYYQEARAKGVVFLRFSEDEEPQVKQMAETGDLRVTVKDRILQETITITAQILALSAATLPNPEAKELAQIYKVPVNDDGFYLEAHMKLRPVDFATDGVFVCGLAHSPKFIEESIAQAKAAAQRATLILVQDKLTSEGAISFIDPDYCVGCKVCVGLCPYNAISFDEEKKVAQVTDVLCKGCGVCASACPTGACSIKNFQTEQIFEEIAAIFG